MSWILDLFLITVIIVNITDISGFMDNLVGWIYLWLYGKKKPPLSKFNIKLLTCSYCLNWWIGLIYLLITGNFSLFGLVVVLLLSFMTTIIYDTLILIKDLIDRLIVFIDKKV